MENISSYGEIEMVCWIRLKSEGLEGGESVDGGDDRLLFKGFDRCIVGGGGGGGG